MKHLILMPVAVLCFTGSFAQSSQKANPVHALHSQMLTGLLQHNSSKAPAMRATTGTTLERVIALSTRDNTAGTLNDSANFRYTATRSSSYDYNTMLFAYNYPYSSSPMFDYAGVFTKPQVLCDTMMHWEVNPNTLVYGYYETGYAGIGVSDELVNYKHLYADSAIYPNMTYSNTFTSANNISGAYSYNFHAGLSDSAFHQLFTYNSANKLVEDSTYEYHLGTWRIASKTYYTYDAANNLIQIDNYANNSDTSFLLPLVEQLKYVNTYDASNRLLTVLNYTFDGTTLGQYIKDTFAYTGSYAYHSAWRETQWDPINHYWAPMFNMTKVINSTTGLPDTVYIRGFDSILNAWVPQTMDVMTYDSYNNPIKLNDYEYSWTLYPATPNFTTTYYYSTYLSTGVEQNVSAKKDNVKIFPNPASGFFNIAELDVPDNSGIFISVVNASGQLLTKEFVRWHGTTRVSVADLIPGTYWVVIQDSGGRMLHTEALMKQ